MMIPITRLNSIVDDGTTATYLSERSWRTLDWSWWFTDTVPDSREMHVHVKSGEETMRVRCIHNVGDMLGERQINSIGVLIDENVPHWNIQLS